MAALAKSMPVPAHLLAADRLDEALRRVHAWGKASEQDGLQTMKRSLRELSTDISRLGDMRAELAEANQQVQAAEQLRLESVRLSEEMRKSAESTAARAGVVAETKEKLDQARADRHRAVAREEALLAEHARGMECRAAEVDQFLAMYRHRLGLDIAPTGEVHEVRFCFSLLTEEEPELKAGVTLRLAADGASYEAVDCSPTLSRLEPMLAILNGSAESALALPAFVCGLRREFAEALRGGRSQRPAMAGA